MDSTVNAQLSEKNLIEMAAISYIAIRTPNGKRQAQ